MKIINYIVIIPSLFGIIYSESGVSCNPIDDSSQQSEVELIDVDVKTLDQNKLTILTPPNRPELSKVEPKEGKSINLIKIDDVVICKALVNYTCSDFLIFRTNTERIYIVLNTSKNDEPFYITIVYDPNGSAVSGITRPSYGNNKLRYIGFIPFLIELNKSNVAQNIQNENPYGLTVDIDDNFDKWYYNYSYKEIQSSDGRHTFKHGTYEPNEGEKFSSVRRARGSIWSYFESTDSMNSFLKMVDVYSKDGVAHLIKLTSTFDVLTYLVYDAASDVWSSHQESNFNSEFRRLGFQASNVTTQGTAQAAAAVDDAGILDVNKLDRSKFDFVKNRLSSVSVVTVVPKEKKLVKKVKFDDINIYPVNSDNYSIDFVKWSDNKYNSETIILHEDHTYNCHYTSQTKGRRLEDYDQEAFYYFVRGRVERNEAAYIQNVPFDFLYAANDDVYLPNPRPVPADPIATSEGTAARATQSRVRPQSSIEAETRPSTTQTTSTTPTTTSQSASTAQQSLTQQTSTTQASPQVSAASTREEQPQVINAAGSVSSSAETINVVLQPSSDTNLYPNLEEVVENGDQTPLEPIGGEQPEVEDQPMPENVEDDENYANDAEEFLNFLKSRSTVNESEQPSQENNLTVNEGVNKKKSGFISTVSAVPLVLLALTSV